jgi:hypothetical protein
MRDASHAEPTSRERALALLICAVAMLYVFPYQATLNNPNENVRLYMTAALVEQGVYEIDALRERWGWVNDAASRGGHLYSVKAPGTSWLGVPAYAAYRAYQRSSGAEFDRTHVLWLCRVTASILPTLAWLWFLYGWLGRRTTSAVLRDCAFFSVALGSLLYGYGMLFVSHTLSAVCAFGSFMLLYELRERAGPVPARPAALAGLLAAGTTLFEYPGLPASLVLAGYALFVLGRAPHPVRPLAAFVAAALLPTLAMMHFQWRAFGNPFTPGHLFVENAAFRAAHEQGLFGAVGPSWAALYGLTIDPGAGLFPLTPLLVFALPGAWLLWRDARSRADAVGAVLVVGLTLLAIASMNNWRGGWTIGPRYLALCVPFAAWLALGALEPLHARMPAHTALLARACLLVGLVASAAPGAYYPHLPPELTRPLPQLITLLVAHDFAPLNAGRWLGWSGSASMLPLALCGLGALWLCTDRAAPLPLRSRQLGLALLVGAALCAPLWARPSAEPGVLEATGFITRRWHPPGDDRAARLGARLRSASVVRDAELRALADLYEREGRSQEARRVLRGRL